MSISLSGIAISGSNARQHKEALIRFLNYQPAGRSPITLMDATSYEFDQVGILVREQSLLILDPYIGAWFEAPETPPPLFEVLTDCSKTGPVLLFDVNGMAETYQYAYFENGRYVGLRNIASVEDEYDTLSEHFPALADEETPEEEKFMGLLTSVLGIQFGFLLGEQNAKVEVFSN